MDVDVRTAQGRALAAAAVRVKAWRLAALSARRVRSGNMARRMVMSASRAGVEFFVMFVMMMSFDYGKRLI